MSWRDASIKYKERIEAAVASAPPLTAEQIARLAVLLTSGDPDGPQIAAALDVWVEGSVNDSTLPKANQDDHDTAA